MGRWPLLRWAGSMRSTGPENWSLWGPIPAMPCAGLGSAVSLACLHALRAAGATQAVVYPRGDEAYPVARHLYFGLGFQLVARTVTFGA